MYNYFFAQLCNNKPCYRAGITWLSLSDIATDILFGGLLVLLSVLPYTCRPNGVLMDEI